MLISICIPTYSRLNYLKEAIESIWNQTYTRFEICVSLDPTPQGPNIEIHNWCMEQVSIYPNFKYNVNEKNLGLAGNWNKLSQMASGEYLMIMGDDDRLLSNCLENFTKKLSHGIDVIFSNQAIIDSSGIRLDVDFNLIYGRSKLKSGILENPEATIWSNSLPMSSSLIRTELVRQFGFKEDLNTPEIEFFLQIVSSGKLFYFIPEILTEYRIHSNSATSQGLKVHRLMDYLIQIPVSAENEHYKINFLNNLAYPSVNRWILESNNAKAKMIYFGRYYQLKNTFKLKGILQFILLILPNRFSKWLIINFKNWK